MTDTHEWFEENKERFRVHDSAGFGFSYIDAEAMLKAFAEARDEEWRTLMLKVSASESAAVQSEIRANSQALSKRQRAEAAESQLAAERETVARLTEAQSNLVFYGKRILEDAKESGLAGYGDHCRNSCRWCGLRDALSGAALKRT